MPAGYYRSDGIQNTGTALRQNNVNAYIYSGTNFTQIYPREQTKTLSNNDFGSFSLRTFRPNGYGWRDCAYQGVKSNGYSTYNPKICYGHITPSAVPRISNLISVESVEIEFKPHKCGWSSRNRTLVFRVALDGNNQPAMGSSKYEYTLAAGTDGYQKLTASGGAGSALANLMYELLTKGTKLMLWNGETSVVTNPDYDDGTGWGSVNYAAIETFKITSLKVKYRP